MGAVNVRGAILDEAKAIINGDRQNQYGDPEDAFETIAHYWNNYLTKFEGSVMALQAKDIALMMVLFKIARESHQGKRDNLVDAAGYLGLAGDIADEMSD